MLGFKLVTFDATNTLLKFRVPPWQYYAIVARDHGFSGTEKEIKDKFLDSYKLMLDKYPNFGRSKINWDNWWRKVVELTFKGQLPVNANVNNIATQLIDEFRTPKCWCVADGSEKLLKLLADSKITIGVISNFDPRLKDILESVKLKKQLDFILTSYEIGYSKPDERIFRHALEICKTSIQPFEALHIGDDFKKDYEGARLAGWQSVLINEDLKNNTKLGNIKNHIYENLNDLSNAIERKALVL